MDDDRRKACSWNPKECGSKTVKSNDHDYSRQNSSRRCPYSRFRFEGSAGERSSSRIGSEARSNGVCNTDSHEFLVGIDLVAIQASEGWGQNQLQIPVTSTSTLHVHLEIAMCSRSKITVATGSLGASAERSSELIVGEPTC